MRRSNRAGTLPYAALAAAGDMVSITTVDEGAVCTAMLDLYQNEGIIAEPAGALSVAALLEADIEPGSTVVCLISGGNNDVSRYGEVLERSLVHLGLKHYFLVDFPQEPGALRRFLDEVLGPNDDITLFEYVKRNNRETGEALVGVELGSAADFDGLLERMRGIRHPRRSAGAGLAGVPLPALDGQHVAALHRSSRAPIAARTPRRWRERSVRAARRTRAASSVSKAAHCRSAAEIGPRARPASAEAPPWCLPAMSIENVVQRRHEVLDSGALRRRPILDMARATLIRRRSGPDEREPQQSLAEAQRPHQRPPALAQVGGGVHRVGGGLDRRDGQELAMAHASNDRADPALRGNAVIHRLLRCG